MFDTNIFIQHSPYVAIFLLLVLSDLGLPFPEDTTLMLSGFLIAHGVIRLLPTVLVIYPTLLATDLFLYFIGRKYGRRVVERKRFQRMITPERLSKLEEKFRKWGILVVFLGRHILGLRAQIFLSAGIVRMSLAKFIMADGASAILTITLMIAIGYAGGNSLQVLKKDITQIEHIMIVIVVIFLAGGIFFWYLKKVRS